MALINHYIHFNGIPKKHSIFTNQYLVKISQKPDGQATIGQTTNHQL